MTINVPNWIGENMAWATIAAVAGGISLGVLQWLKNRQDANVKTAEQTLEERLMASYERSTEAFMSLVETQKRIAEILADFKGEMGKVKDEVKETNQRIDRLSDSLANRMDRLAEKK